MLHRWYASKLISFYRIIIILSYVELASTRLLLGQSHPNVGCLPQTFTSLPASSQMEKGVADGVCGGTDGGGGVQGRTGCVWRGGGGGRMRMDSTGPKITFCSQRNEGYRY